MNFAAVRIAFANTSFGTISGPNETISAWQGRIHTNFF
jgi:hypothetical protein